MRRKEIVKISSFIGIASLLLVETMALPVYGAKGILRLTETVASPACAEKDKIKTSEPTFAGKEELSDKGFVLEENNESDDTAKAENVPVRLQVPQKFDIVLDPWEMDGREQIYSENYTIKNTGKTEGILKITGIAIGQDVNIWSESDGIHDGDEQDLFIELVINGGDRLTLLPEGTDYEVMLEADASVTLKFTGEVNENAEEGWHDRDVKITVIYDWFTDFEEDIAENKEVPKESDADEELMSKENMKKTAADETDEELREEEIQKAEASDTAEEVSLGDNSGDREEKETEVETTEADDDREEKETGVDTTEASGEEEKNSSIDVTESDKGEGEKSPDSDMPKEDDEEEEKAADTETAESNEAGEENNSAAAEEENGEDEKNTEKKNTEEEDGTNE